MKTAAKEICRKTKVVNIAQMLIAGKSDLVEKIGSVSPGRMNQVIEGVKRDRVACLLEGGMEEGVNDSYDRLDKLFENMRKD